jgi:dual-specificity kinase
LKGSRYIVARLLGQGTYGRVLEVIDSSDRSINAIKVVRPGPYIREAKREERVIKRLNQLDPQNQIGIIRIQNSFAMNRHYCLVTERYGRSLYDLIRRNRYQGFDIDSIRTIALNVLQSIEFIHNLGLTHTDLKPENILFERDGYKFDKIKGIYLPPSLKVRLIDFGGATFENEEHSSLITTRHYRAPEVILSKFYIESG